MLWIVVTFLVISLIFYCVLGGADFGAGALGLFVPPKRAEKHEELVNKAMGPVWEANHIWLIILIVILFNGFPSVYTQYSIYFHLPLTLMLIGIVLRGCAFTFRHYDVIKDRSHRYYTGVFSFSSLLTPVMFGMIMGAVFQGVDPYVTGYYQKYVASWFNLFSFSVGIFVLSLFVYLASAYLVGEADDKLMKDFYLRCAQKANIILVLGGAMVFVLAQASHHSLLKVFFTNPLSVLFFITAGILTLVFWIKILQDKLTEWSIRLIAGSKAALILSAWLAVIFPNVLFYTDGTKLSLLTAAAPAATINILAWSLMIGALLFLPILYYLIRIFKIMK